MVSPNIFWKNEPPAPAKRCHCRYFGTVSKAIEVPVPVIGHREVKRSRFQSYRGWPAAPRKFFSLVRSGPPESLFGQNLYPQVVVSLRRCEPSVDIGVDIKQYIRDWRTSLTYRRS